MFIGKNHSKTFLSVCALILFLGITVLLKGTVFAACSFTVSNTNDSGAGSLRNAITSAGNGNTICLVSVVVIRQLMPHQAM